jgi:hypothetical protein
MLGRLKMTIDDCIKAYLSLSGKIFADHNNFVARAFRFLTEGVQYDAHVLEAAIKSVVKEHLGSEDATFYDEKSSCKV